MNFYHQAICISFKKKKKNVVEETCVGVMVIVKLPKFQTDRKYKQSKRDVILTLICS